MVLYNLEIGIETTMIVTKYKLNLILDDDGNASIGEMENQSGRDEASSGSPSIERLGGALGLGLGGGGRKRKSRNPTRINLANMMDDNESKIKTGLDNQGKVAFIFVESMNIIQSNYDKASLFEK